MSPHKKRNPSLNQPLHSKYTWGGIPLYLGWQEPLTLRERTLPTLTVISRSRLDLTNYPCTPESRHLRLVMCHSWTSIRLPRFKDPKEISDEEAQVNPYIMLISETPEKAVSLSYQLCLYQRYHTDWQTDRRTIM
ncbi:hypothetical protein J6590_064348 [Homalodisca vitripennis]|nr:hypothetical protein J6590_064348 [Homalodisca vitripennis]